MAIPLSPEPVATARPLDLPPVSLAQARQVAEEYESVFIGQMLQHMFAGIETDAMFGGGPAEDIYRSMMVDEFGRAMSQAGGVGLADHIVRSLMSLQEVTPS